MLIKQQAQFGMEWREGVPRRSTRFDSHCHSVGASMLKVPASMLAR